MPEENMNQKFRLKKLNEIRNCLIEEINRNELINKKHKKNCGILNYFVHSLIAIATITGCVSIFVFASLVGIPIRVACSAIGLKISVITTGIKTCNLIIKKKKKYDKIRLLPKYQLNSIQVLKYYSNSNISHDEFVLISNVLEEFYVMKEEVKNCNNKLKFKLYIKQCCLIV